MAVAALLLLVLVPTMPGAPDGNRNHDQMDVDGGGIVNNPIVRAKGLGDGYASPTSNPPISRPRSFNSTMEIENMTMAIDEGSVLRHLEKLVAFKTRYTYSPQSHKAAEYIYDVFRSCGLDVQYYDSVSGVTEIKDVIGTLEGANASAPPYYMGAHYDSVSTTSYYDAQGADDDGTGTAAVMAAAEVLSHYRFNRTIVFCAFSGEEQGLLGSKAYTRSLYQAGKNVSGAICLDMIGYNPAPGDRDVVVRANGASMDLAYFIHNISQKYGSMVVNGSARLNLAMNSDHAAFWPYGWDGALLIEEKMETNSNPNYHQPGDTIGYLNMTYAANSTQLAVASIAELAVLVSGDESGPTYELPFPSPDGYSNETPTISLNALDPSSIAPSTIRLYIDGSAVAHSALPIPGGLNITFVPSAPWADSRAIECHIMANDTLGNRAHYWWNFTVDAIAPGAPVPGSIELSRIRADKLGTVLDLGPPGSYDDYHVLAPSVMRDAGVLKMWYGAYDGGIYRIAYATSVNGLNWTRCGVVLSPGSAGQPDSLFTSDCSVIKVGAVYRMWYSAHNGTTYRIMQATSPDGENWTKQGLAIDLGPPGALDDVLASNPEVIVVGPEYWMYYTASDGITFRILRAVSTDGLNWTRAGVSINPGPPGEKDSTFAQGPAVIFDGGRFLCYYSGFDGLRYRILKATSTDGRNWTRFGLAIDVGTTGSYDYVAAAHPAILIEGGTIHVWYSGSNGNYRIMYAISSESGPGAKKESIVLRWTGAAGEVAGYEVYPSTTWAGCLNPPNGGWLKAQNGIFIHNGMGAGNSTTYYYALRSVDRVGHTTMHWMRALKAAVVASAGWTLLGHVDSGLTNLTTAYESISWTSLMAWNSSDASNQWRTNFTVRPAYMNDLASLWSMAGCWAMVENASAFVSVGLVRNVTLQLQPGWNLVSYPHAAVKTAAEIMAEIGTPCTSIEGFDQSATYRLKTLSGADQMNPGRSYWIHLDASATWDIHNY